MIPIRDESRSPAGFPVVTASLVGLNVLVFLLELSGGDPFVIQWSVTPAEIVAGHHWITLLTGMFMHGSWSHIIGNMIYLWAFGPVLEDRMKPRRYLAFYLTGGIVAALAQIAGDPSSTVPNLGASGAIAAVMGGFMVTYPTDRIRTIIFFGFFFRVTFIPAALLIGFWFVIQLISVGTIAGAQSSGGVAYLAHVGGLVYGAAVARLFEDRTA